MSEQERNELTQLLEQEKDFLHAHAIQLARKGEDADDLYQETVMKAFRGFGSFSPGTNFRAWIGRIMLNTHINNYNRRKSRMDVACDLSSGECDTTVFHGVEDPVATFSDSPERIFFSNHIDERLIEKIYSLPDAYRRPFTLYHLEGYTYEEISDMLDVPIGTVKSRIFRARKMVKDLVTEEGRYAVN